VKFIFYALVHLGKLDYVVELVFVISVIV